MTIAVRALLIRQSVVLALFAMTLAALVSLAGCASTVATVTMDGIEVQDSFTVHVVQRLDSIETTMVTTGELLLLMRGHFSSAQWDDVARISQAGTDGLSVARTLLVDYVNASRKPAITMTQEKAQAQSLGEQRVTIERQLSVLAMIMTEYIALRRGE